MLLSLRMYCQYSMGVDQKILSIREEQGLIRGGGGGVGWLATPHSLCDSGRTLTAARAHELTQNN